MSTEHTLSTSALSSQLLEECQAMARHAFQSGLTVPVATIRHVDSFERSDANARLDLLDELIRAHRKLIEIVHPTTPETLVMLSSANRNTPFSRLLGPVALVRHMTVVSLLLLLLFVLLTIFQDAIAAQFAFGPLYFLAAAGLGASFTALHKANAYVEKGTFDPTYSFSYWIRFALGLTAGPVLSLIVPFDESGSSLSPVLLALLGGFSSDVLYTVLTRITHSLETLVAGPSATPTAETA